MKLMKNKRGAALMQVLLVTAILAGIATYILRASLSRTSNARRTRRTISAQLLIGSCMAEVNTLWAAKDPEVFFRDMDQCIMYCKDNTDDTQVACTNGNSVRSYTCRIKDGEKNNSVYSVVADMVKQNGECKVTYTVQDKTGQSGFSSL